MRFLQLIPLFLILSVFLIGTYVFSRNPKNKVNRIFLFYSIISTFIAFSEYEFIFANSVETALFWLKIYLFIWPVLFVVQLHFLLEFTKAGFLKNINNIFFVYVVALFVAVHSYLNDIFPDFTSVSIGYIRTPTGISSSAEFIFAIFMTLLTLMTTIIGIRYILRSASQKKKMVKAVLVMAGLLIPTWLPFIKNGILPALDIRILFADFQFIFIGWLCFVVAIWRYEMFDITFQTTADKIVSTMKEALMLADEEGIIVSGNEAFYGLFGFDEEEIVGKPVTHFLALSPKDGDQIGGKYKQEEIRNGVCNFRTKEREEAFLSLSVSFLKTKKKVIVGYVFVISDITELIKTENELKSQQQHMIEMAHQAGMAEIATNTMHNIGNILNSVNISSEHFFSILEKSKVEEFSNANKLFINNMDNLHDFLNRDERGKLLPGYLNQVVQNLQENNEELKTESARLSEKINLIGGAIELQQVQAKSLSFKEQVSLVSLVEEVLQILDERLLKSSIILLKKFTLNDSYIIRTSRSKLLNIFLNIIRNAIDSVEQNDVNNRKIKLEIFKAGKSTAQVNISDNGAGIEKEVLPEIFKFGFTTKEQRNGFGLYYCMTALEEIRGSISVKSQGKNKGAVFSISLPCMIKHERKT